MIVASATCLCTIITITVYHSIVGIVDIVSSVTNKSYLLCLTNIPWLNDATIFRRSHVPYTPIEKPLPVVAMSCATATKLQTVGTPVERTLNHLDWRYIIIGWRKLGWLGASVSTNLKLGVIMRRRGKRERKHFFTTKMRPVWRSPT